MKEVAVAFQEPFGNRESHSIYQALLQASKAAEFRSALALDRMSNQSVAMHFPIVVYSGDLFLARVEVDDVVIEPTRHLACQLAYRSRHYDRTYLVDVVTPDQLPVLAKKIQDFADTLADLISKAQHSPKTVQSFGLNPRTGVHRKARIKGAIEEGVQVVIGGSGGT